jgi:hypothetical protein
VAPETIDEVKLQTSLYDAYPRLRQQRAERGARRLLHAAQHACSSRTFGSDFPSVDPFPDPSTLASPFPLRKSNRGQVAVALMALAHTAIAQSGPTGSLSGRVIDQSQGAVPGVTVTALNTATNDARTNVTNADGVFGVAALPVGKYELTFQLDGFKTVMRAGILVEAAVPRTIDVQLEVGGLTEEVTVTSDSSRR